MDDDRMDDDDDGGGTVSSCPQIHFKSWPYQLPRVARAVVLQLCQFNMAFWVFQ